MGDFDRVKFVTIPRTPLTNTVYEEHGILLYRRDRTMVAHGKIYFEA